MPCWVDIPERPAFFFFKGNRRGVDEWEGEVAKRRTGKSRRRGKCNLDTKRERIKEKKSLDEHL